MAAGTRPADVEPSSVKRVLVVEDDSANQALLILDMVRVVGIEAGSAEGGPTDLERIRETHYDWS
ncbi:hypothetical protein [Rubrivirga sp.]|uniref:hypothetical protein n=1 Tax=Rubrivirga sp. TaxID=1885344 RepID=UPI003C792B24